MPYLGPDDTAFSLPVNMRLKKEQRGHAPYILGKLFELLLDDPARRFDAVLVGCKRPRERSATMLRYMATAGAPYTQPVVVQGWSGKVVCARNTTLYGANNVVREVLRGRQDDGEILVTVECRL